jgi:hypothetical protein
MKKLRLWFIQNEVVTHPLMCYYLAQTQNNQTLPITAPSIWKPIFDWIVDELHLNLTVSLTGL